jgi:hypothetical protein
MNKTEYMVYWTEPDGTSLAEKLDEMVPALNFMQSLRKDGARFVTLSTETVDNVGKLGVDSLTGDTCPDGKPFLGRTSRYGMFLKRGR